MYKDEGRHGRVYLDYFFAVNFYENLTKKIALKLVLSVYALMICKISEDF
jgi:hypothetical protein